MSATRPRKCQGHSRPVRVKAPFIGRCQTLTLTLILALAISVWCNTSQALAEQFIIVQSTTSTQNSGLYAAILPDFKTATGIEARIVAVGTGQAIKNARNCDGDVLLVHARQSELAFVKAGYGLARYDVMYNDFVVVGPEDNPAGVLSGDTATAALDKIARSRTLFISRGDDSGTHTKERHLWSRTTIDPVTASGDWYREAGSGMGATLNVAVGLGGYTLTDRATWLTFGNRQGHRIWLQGDPALFNQYGVIPVNPNVCPNVKTDLADTFVRWITSQEGQSAIAAYRVEGQQLFFPNAR